MNANLNLWKSVSNSQSNESKPQFVQMSNSQFYDGKPQFKQKCNSSVLWR